MSVRKTHDSRIDCVLFVSFCTLLAMSFVNASGINSDLARAAVALDAYHQDEGFFPIRGSVYQSTGGTSFPVGPDPIQLVTITARDQFNNPIPNHVALPVPEVSAEVDISLRLSIEFLTSTEHDNVVDYGPALVSVSGVSSSPTEGVWQTEILSVDFSSSVSGGNGTLTYSVRESPTLPSLGSHTITELPGGRSLIDSFFDVFFEISIDDGPYVPADGSVRLELTAIVPEPASLLLACLAGLLCLANRLRHRR
jgi:hypothetical protein